MEDNGQQVAAEHTTDRAIDPESEKVHPAAQQATPAVQELPPEGTAQPIELGRPGSAAIKGVACASNQLLAGHDAHGQSNGSESEDPDAYDVVHLDRLLDYEQDDKFVWKDSEPIVARKGVAHSPGDPKGRHSGLQRGTFSNKIETSPMRQNFLPAPEPQMSVRRAKVHDSVPSSDSGPASQSGGKVCLFPPTCALSFSFLHAACSGNLDNFFLALSR